MATDSKLANNPVTKEVESRLKQSPEHLFEVFLEIREPNDKEAPEVLLKYPAAFSDDILKTAPNFAYPCKIPPDEQGEHFAFVVLDPSGTLFRFGYCRRSNREATCLCIISYYPWFETFYTILNDLSQIINSKSTEDVEQFLLSLYNYKLTSNTEGKETIEIRSLTKNYLYSRPDTRKLPTMLTNRNFAVMFSRLGTDVMLSLFAHLLFERRILFVSSKLFHLTACAYGCLHLISPMHWQSIFLPILPESMTWTTQCTAPYIIGVHSTVFATLNMNELGDVVIVNIDEKKLETQYNDLSSFPKYLSRSLKKGIQQSTQLPGDHLARVFLRAMAFAIGNYASGFVIRNEKLDFDRDLYLQQYLGSHVSSFMSSVAHTQMFEQWSRYRTYLQLQRETDIDEFDLEVKNYQQLQQSKKFKTNKKIYKLLEKYIKYGTTISSNTLTRKRTSLFDAKDDKNKAANPLIEQVQNKAGKLQTVMNKAGQRVANEASSVKNNLTSLDISDVMKRNQNSKLTNSNSKNHLSMTMPNLGTNAADSGNQKSIPYERLDSNEVRLFNSDQIDSSSSDSSRSSTPEPESEPEKARISRLISLENDDNPLLPMPIVLNVINSPQPTGTPRAPINQVDSKIKQLQNELQYKVQTFDGKRVDPRNEYGQQTEIKKLVKQFDPLEDTNKSSDDLFFSSSVPVNLRLNNNNNNNNNHKLSSSATADRHPSLYETIPTNHVTSVLQNIQTNYGTTSRIPLQPTVSVGKNPINFYPKLNPIITNESLSTTNFDPLAPNSYSDSSSSSDTNGSNLIDF